METQDFIVGFGRWGQSLDLADIQASGLGVWEDGNIIPWELNPDGEEDYKFNFWLVEFEIPGSVQGS